jgi:chemotaxis protein CheD
MTGQGRPAGVQSGGNQPADNVGEHRLHIIQGEFFVTDDPNVVLTTILGSCVAACIRDPAAQVGGMNHFLLPGSDSSSNRQEAERQTVHLMELLLNGLLKRGAQRQRLEAKLFGGARTMEGLADIGAMNANFAEGFLRLEGISVIGGSLRGARGRRIQFWPVSGRARQAFINAESGLEDKASPGLVPPPAAVPARTLPPSGAVEFF